MRLPVMPPLKPMLAKAADAVPTEPDGVWLYEPKWDGFRVIVYRDGDEVMLGSRNEKPLTRYFPDVVEAVLRELPERVVLDGELVVPREREGRQRLDWESLSQRIHPAESRIRMLAQATPAHVVAFDCLAFGDEDLTYRPLAVRRAFLTDAIGPSSGSVLDRQVHQSVSTLDAALARDWFDRFEGAGLDGVIAKRLDGPYKPDQRAMIKVKHHRSAECVVVGYRKHKSIDGIGSLLLGLYEGERLHMVGGASAFTAPVRRELLERLQEFRTGEASASGEPNRWNQREDHSWVPLRPELVVEVAYDQMEGDRFRHAARLVRWRPDKDPAQCTYDQLDVPARYDLADVLTG